MKVVSNSSVLLALGYLGKLDILSSKFAEVVVPPAVWREVVEEGRERPGAREVKAAPWVKVTKPSTVGIAEVAGGQLGQGEGEAIALAKQLGLFVILMDEKAGRCCAENTGLLPLGTLGILLLAKRNKLVAKVGPLLATLKEQAKFRVSDAVLADVLRAAGE